MIDRKCFITSVLIAIGVLVGCDGQRLSSPTARASSTLSASSNGASPSFSNSAFRSGRLKMTKECSAYTGLPGSYCTISASDLKEIEAGSRVVYAGTIAGGKLNSDLYLDTPGPGNNIAFGHVSLDLTISPPRGLVTFAGGTGKFTHFHATIDVTPLNPADHSWNWDGPYNFQP
jgi:hypothetical protein